MSYTKSKFDLEILRNNKILIPAVIRGSVILVQGVVDFRLASRKPPSETCFVRPGFIPVILC